MAMSNAEKQKLYRERHFAFSEDHEPLHRLQTILSSSAYYNLERMIKTTGKTKREIIDQAIVELSDRLTLAKRITQNYSYSITIED